MQELKKITRIKWNLEFYDYIEVFSRLFITLMTIYSFGHNIATTQKNITIPLGIFIMGILAIWSIKPLITKIRSEEYYEEEKDKTNENDKTRKNK